MRNIDKYKNDLKVLLERGNNLDIAMKYECYPEVIEKHIKAALKDAKKTKDYISKIRPFKSEYQSWYSEALVLIKQLLQDRLPDLLNFMKSQKQERKYCMAIMLSKTTCKD